MHVCIGVSVCLLILLASVKAQSEFDCVKPGKFPVGDKDCQQYYFCYWDGTSYSLRKLKCPNKTLFNPAREMCVLASSYTCTSYATTPVNSTAATRTTRTSTTTSTTTTTSTRTTSTTTTSTSTSNPSYNCVKDGKFPADDADCQTYYVCLWDGISYNMWKLKCPNSTRFNPARELCVAPDAYSCNESSTDTTTSEPSAENPFSTTTEELPPTIMEELPSTTTQESTAMPNLV